MAGAWGSFKNPVTIGGQQTYGAYATAPVDPYASLPDLKPDNNDWYQNELYRLNRLSEEAARRQALYARQSSQQATDFSAEYARQRQLQLEKMTPQARPRLSRMFMLGGY